MNKLNLVIIDDEPVSADGIKMIIEKRDLNINVSRVFYSSIKALEFIEKNTVDIVITDINMPNLTGLDLISEIKKINDNIQFIIITGYGSLNYAQKAMRFGVKYFLEKPSSPVELIESLDNCVEDYLIQYKDKFLKSKEIIEKRILGETISSNLEENFSLLLYDDQHFPDIHKALERDLKRNGISFSYSNIKGIVTYFLFKNEIATELFDETQNLEKDMVIYFCSNKNIDSVKKAFHVGKNILRIDFYVDGTLFLSEGDGLAYQFQTDSKDDISSIFELSFQAISINDLKNARQEISDAFALVKTKFIDVEVLKEESIQFCNRLRSLYYIDNETQVEETKKMIETSKNYKILLSAIIDLIELTLTKAQFETNDLSISSKLDWIIHEYYDNGDLSLRWISKNLLYLNPEYLGKVYFKETSQKFANKLLEVRMSEAARLLAEGYKIYDVALMVGFENTPDYFGQQFKKYYGVTPKKYVQNL